MKKRIIAVLTLAIVALCSVSCAKIQNKLKMPKATDGNPTAATHFEFTLTESGDGYEIARKKGDVLPMILTLPSTYNGKPIVAVAKSGFIADENISQVIIPASIQKVGDYAFKACKNLGSVTFGYNATTENGAYKESQVIGAYAFDGCSSLKTVNAACVTQMGTDAFRGCSSSLTYKNLADGVKKA